MKQTNTFTMKISGVRLAEYYRLTKPGIVYGNALTAAAGFFLAAHGNMHFTEFILMLLGISLVVACGCVLNNYYDRDIDAKMERTKNRPLVRSTISLHDAISFGILLGLLGSVMLYFVNVLTLAVALFGLFMYVVVYSMWSKRYTLHATLIGAVSGAVPPVVGYAAASHTLDLGALIVFVILFSWQMPHALAIALRRLDDYRAANIPVMPLVRSVFATYLQMLAYAIVFFLASISLYGAGYAGWIFGFVMGGLGVVWIVLCAYSFWATDKAAWAKKIFLYSLLLILAFCFLSAVDFVL